MLSIAVCTRNRPHRLRQWLAALAHLDGIHATPIVVIDQSTQANPPHTPLTITYQHTTTRGLSRARNLALNVATTRYVAFCDDDCVPRHDWIYQLQRIIAECAPAIAFGATWPSGAPDSYALQYAHTHAGHTVWALRHDGHGCGALQIAPHAHYAHHELPILETFGQGNNMLIERNIARTHGGFHPWLGAGAWLQAGEDVDVALGMLRRGALVIYQPTQVVWHDAWQHPADLARHEHGYTTGMIATHLWHAWHGSTVARDYLRWRVHQLQATLFGDRTPTSSSSTLPTPSAPRTWRWKFRRIWAIGMGIIGGVALIVGRRWQR